MHKSLAGLGLALVVWSAACGGSSKPTTTPPPDVAPPLSACAQAAAHTKEILLASNPDEGDTVALEKVAPVIERVMRERCETDQWVPAVVACINQADDRSMDACVEQLSEAQQKAVEEQLDRELDPIMEQERKQKGEAPTGAPAPGSPAPPPPDDPCGGGA